MSLLLGTRNKSYFGIEVGLLSELTIELHMAILHKLYISMHFILRPYLYSTCINPFIPWCHYKELLCLIQSPTSYAAVVPCPSFITFTRVVAGTIFADFAIRTCDILTVIYICKKKSINQRYKYEIQDTRYVLWMHKTYNTRAHF